MSRWNFPLVSSLLMGRSGTGRRGKRDRGMYPARRNATLNRHAGSGLYRRSVGVIYPRRYPGCRALAFGTESIHAVDKIVGPGNKYVTAAKKTGLWEVGIDFIAGPSEVLIIADDTAERPGQPRIYWPGRTRYNGDLDIGNSLAGICRKGK